MEEAAGGSFRFLWGKRDIAGFGLRLFLTVLCLHWPDGVSLLAWLWSFVRRGV